MLMLGMQLAWNDTHKGPVHRQFQRRSLEGSKNRFTNGRSQERDRFLGTYLYSHWLAFANAATHFIFFLIGSLPCAFFTWMKTKFYCYFLNMRRRKITSILNYIVWSKTVWISVWIMALFTNGKCVLFKINSKHLQRWIAIKTNIITSLARNVLFTRIRQQTIKFMTKSRTFQKQKSFACFSL